MGAFKELDIDRSRVSNARAMHDFLQLLYGQKLRRLINEGIVWDFPLSLKPEEPYHVYSGLGVILRAYPTNELVRSMAKAIISVYSQSTAPCFMDVLFIDTKKLADKEGIEFESMTTRELPCFSVYHEYPEEETQEIKYLSEPGDLVVRINIMRDPKPAEGST